MSIECGCLVGRAACLTWDGLRQQAAVCRTAAQVHATLALAAGDVVTPAEELLKAADSLEALARWAIFDLPAMVQQLREAEAPISALLLEVLGLTPAPLAAWLRVEARVERLDHSHALAVARAVNGGAA